MKKKIIRYLTITLMLMLSFSAGFLIVNSIGIELEPFEYVFESFDTPVSTFFKILFNNLFFSFFLIIGIGILTILLILWQGFQLGAMCSIWLSTGNSIKEYILLMLPHGIIEFIVLIMFAVIGLELFDIIKKAINGQKVNFEMWLHEHRNIVIVGTSLILVAAVIETTLTPYLYNILR